MQIDWNQTINDIFADKLCCLRCGSATAELVAGFSRAPSAAEYSPRQHECTHKEDCDARKLVLVCETCAREIRLRARPVDAEALMTMVMNECRRELEECLDYLADDWQDDLDVDPADVDQRLESIAPDVFAEEAASRQRLEEEYLTLHRWFRRHHYRIPNPGWRAEYVEELLELGYSTLLGD